MENTVVASGDGEISEILLIEGILIEQDDVILTIC